MTTKIRELTTTDCGVGILNRGGLVEVGRATFNRTRVGKRF